MSVLNPDKITAICPSVERADLVKQLAESCRKAFGFALPELVIVAQGREDGTEGWCRKEGLEVIKSQETLSFARANNIVASQSTADWLLLLNNDLILRKGFWDGLSDMVSKGYEIIGGKLLYPNNTIQHYGKWFTLDFYPFHVLRNQPADHPLAQDIRPFPDVTFACVLIRKDVWDELGGLDESYFNGFEDDDFCLKAKRQGAQIGVHPDVKAIHLESQTSGLDNQNKEEQWRKFHKRWVETGDIQWALGIYQGWRNV